MLKGHTQFNKREISLNLILEVKKYPILYDHDHENYKNMDEANNIWDKIGEKMNLNRKIRLNDYGLFSLLIICLFIFLYLPSRKNVQAKMGRY